MPLISVRDYAVDVLRIQAFLAEAQFMNLLDASGFGVATDAKPSDNVLASGRMAEFFLLDI
ncbi:uncharacterized protein AFUA_1G13810 [Aspergillus fumigatus Af293]|uniref:Uncharacterized protein n=2 Tax=Aspergillus fumigatus TaxID=746128 RepID=Q4WS69_ASPFU|nr:hypothetical protein AFUA_1G13810 [Aspergillus fumigatus Af293]EAL90713.1 hypothetical protein AFUA_1G13810 [Aspergillus fumigatus Af293]EDP56618.1 hypothetical protein AFUB_013290 [Aspergillus fumigatus A1163]